MSDAIRHSAGTTGLPVSGTGKGPWGTPILKSYSQAGASTFKAEHMNELRAVLEALSQHTHEYQYVYTVPELEPDTITISADGASSGKKDKIGTSGTAYAAGGMILKWGRIGAEGSVVDGVHVLGNAVFDQAFPNSCSTVIIGANVLGTLGFKCNSFVSGFSAAGFTYSGDYAATGTSDITYIAIGS